MKADINEALNSVASECEPPKRVTVTIKPPYRVTTLALCAAEKEATGKTMADKESEALWPGPPVGFAMDINAKQKGPAAPQQVSELVVKIKCDASEATATLAALQAQVEALTKQFTELKAAAQSALCVEPSITAPALPESIHRAITEASPKIAEMAKKTIFETVTE